jgi:hypothetical protein
MSDEPKQTQNPLLQALSGGGYCPFRNGACAKTCTFYNHENGLCDVMLACKSIFSIAWMVQNYFADDDSGDDADDDTVNDAGNDTVDDAEGEKSQEDKRDGE